MRIQHEERVKVTGKELDAAYKDFVKQYKWFWYTIEDGVLSIHGVNKIEDEE